jgi:hypothetical protein|tara:strand:+ start:405 stop:563 length:159 start_codon:yes stop_codon:yes gene_type:complete
MSKKTFEITFLDHVEAETYEEACNILKEWIDINDGDIRAFEIKQLNEERQKA